MCLSTWKDEYKKLSHQSNVLEIFIQNFKFISVWKLKSFDNHIHRSGNSSICRRVYPTIWFCMQFIYQFNVIFFIHGCRTSKAKAKHVADTVISNEYVKRKMCKCKFDRFSLISWISGNWLHFVGILLSSIQNNTRK